MMKTKITVVLESGEVLTLNAKSEMKESLMMLEKGYVLTGNYNLYKVKGNIICGEKIEYEVLDINIEK